MKRWIGSILVICSLFACVSCTDGENSVSTGSNEDVTEFRGSVAELIETQAHVEKEGYVFCGYFEDEKFTKRVKQSFDEVPTEYYAKYQPDRSALLSLSYTGESPQYEWEQVIYATDYQDAAMRYVIANYLDEVRFTLSAEFGLQNVLGKEVSRVDYIIGCKNRNQFYNFQEDLEELSFYVADGENITRMYAPRTNEWTAYIGEPTTTDDGFSYYIVNNEYAVVVGYEKTERVETLRIPETIDGKEVRNVSFFEDAMDSIIDIGTLVIPGCVENAMLYFYQNSSNEEWVDKFVFEEGVQTIQLCGTPTAELVFPSTAYYIDISNQLNGVYAPMEKLYVADQNVTVNGGEHYFTDNGILYTVEGDMVYQFAGRGDLTLKIKNGTKRVLRRSVNGIAKNVFIPESVEFFDLFYNEYSPRYNYVEYYSNSSSNARQDEYPVYYCDSASVLEDQLVRYVSRDGYTTAKLLAKNAFPFVIFTERVEWESIINASALTAEEKTALIQKIENVSLKQEENVLYIKEFELETLTHSGEWTVFSYLNNDYPKEDLSFDQILESYNSIVYPKVEIPLTKNQPYVFEKSVCTVYDGVSMEDLGRFIPMMMPKEQKRPETVEEFENMILENIDDYSVRFNEGGITKVVYFYRAVESIEITDTLCKFVNVEGAEYEMPYVQDGNTYTVTDGEIELVFTYANNRLSYTIAAPEFFEVTHYFKLA